MNKYEEIRSQTVNEDWSKQIADGATIADLDEKAIMKAREGYKEHYPNQKKEVDSWSDEVFLNKAKITIDGKITHAAILLWASLSRCILSTILVRLFGGWQERTMWARCSLSRSC
jgi:predicted HTH transcriptional regulator